MAYLQKSATVTVEAGASVLVGDGRRDVLGHHLCLTVREDPSLRQREARGQLDEYDIAKA